jgi:hypothetical protein
MGNEKRKMPKVEAIVNYWKDNYCESFDSSFCWGCGFPNFGILDRAHLHARCKGGSDEPDNLVLLCRFCHSNVQEMFTDTKEQSNKIRSMILEGMPFFNIRVSFFTEKIKTGLYEDRLDEMKIKKSDWVAFKNNL